MRLIRTGPGSTKLLPRDRYHCTFTSKVDIESLERGDVDLSAEPPRGLGGSYLGVARIVSRPLSSWSGRGAEGVGGMTDAAQRKVRAAHAVRPQDRPQDPRT